MLAQSGKFLCLISLYPLNGSLGRLMPAVQREDILVMNYACLVNPLITLFLVKIQKFLLAVVSVRRSDPQFIIFKPKDTENAVRNTNFIFQWPLIALQAR
jgi:hypothetical protein